MPNNLHPAKWGPRNTEFDKYITKLLAEHGYGHEREYVGCATQERAEVVRRGLKNGGRHLGHSVKAFWKPCPTGGCDEGGDDCAFHVYFTVYDPSAARAYKERQQESARTE